MKSLTGPDMNLASSAFALPRLPIPGVKPLMLVVDDQPANIQILYELFKDQHEVCMATDGRDALLFCQSRKPDLILLDVVMPEMGGYAVCQQLKADPLTRDIPIIFVTGQNDPEDEARGLTLGGADFITKPFHANVVAARVRTQLTLKEQADQLRAREAELRQRHTELEAANEALKDSEKRLRMITDNLPVLVTYIDSEHRFRFANETLKRWTGHAPHEVDGKLFSEVMGGAVYDNRRDHIERALAGERVDFEMKADAFGQVRYLQSTYIPDIGPDGVVRGIYTVSNDITVLKQSELELLQLSRFDSLTGLPNRSYLYEILDAALEQGQRSGAALAVLFLDIDHFKSINDTLGHAGGDLVLQEFAQRLAQAVRKTDTVARLAGDEFVILLEGARSYLEVETVASKILCATQKPWLYNGTTIMVTTSIGIAFDGQCRNCGAVLIAQADEVMYEAKAAGRNAFRMRTCQSS